MKAILNSCPENSGSCYGAVSYTHLVYEICDRVTILKDGVCEGEYGINELDEISLVSKMIGQKAVSYTHLRNDIGRIAAFGSVEVTEYKLIHRYSKIMHICSQVEGNIKPGLDGCSVVEALLPAGTLSGAPKLRACEIIEKLESVPRGIYGGEMCIRDRGSISVRTVK